MKVFYFCSFVHLLNTCTITGTLKVLHCYHFTLLCGWYKHRQHISTITSCSSFGMPSISITTAKTTETRTQSIGTIAYAPIRTFSCIELKKKFKKKQCHCMSQSPVSMLNNKWHAQTITTAYRFQ